MDLTDRLPRESARDYAIRIIRANIIATTLEPGSMVSENELASEMGLSRTPVREALIELSKTGIVEIYPQHGSLVSRIDYAKVEEANFMRKVLETAVVEEICHSDPPADLHELEDNLSLQDLYLAKGDTGKVLGLDNEFHRGLFSLAKKELCYQLVAAVSAHFDRVRQLSLSVVKNPRVVQDHHRILDAIKQRDAESAKQAMHEHLGRFQIDKDLIRERYPQYFQK